MIFITQLIYLQENQQDTFDQFEAIAIPLIEKYNGKLLLRVRPGSGTVIEKAIESPYEIHLVEFSREEDLTGFMKDETRKTFLHLKEKSIRSAVMIKGEKM
jgi:uncharacterized protein (DUF1330 family)